MARHPPFARCLRDETTAADRQWLAFLAEYLKDWEPLQVGDPLCGLLALTVRYGK